MYHSHHVSVNIVESLLVPLAKRAERVSSKETPSGPVCITVQTRHLSALRPFHGHGRLLRLACRSTSIWAVPKILAIFLASLAWKPVLALFPQQPGLRQAWWCPFSVSIVPIILIKTEHVVIRRLKDAMLVGPPDVIVKSSYLRQKPCAMPSREDQRKWWFPPKTLPPLAWKHLPKLVPLPG